MGFLVKSERIPKRNDAIASNSQGSSSSSNNFLSKLANKKVRRGIASTNQRNNDPVIHDSEPPTSIDTPKKPQASKNVKYLSATGSQNTLSLKERIRSARKRGMKGDVHDMQYLVEEGPLSFRSFAFFGGIFMILASSLDYIETEEDPVARLITFNLWFVGFITTQIEGRPFHMQVPFFYDCICLFFSFLRYVWGRGFLYFLSGCFQFFLFTKYNMISGVFFMIIGAFSIVFGYKASVRLAALRNSIQSKDEIKFMFHSFDRDRDGYLNSEEFREMLMAMGQNLEHNDFVAAMSAVDMENNQMISYHDLEAWWTGYNEDDLPPGSSCMPCTRYPHNPNAHLMT